MNSYFILQKTQTQTAKYSKEIHEPKMYLHLFIHSCINRPNRSIHFTFWETETTLNL